jgi:hypothetical protein
MLSSSLHRCSAPTVLLVSFKDADSQVCCTLTHSICLCPKNIVGLKFRARKLALLIIRRLAILAASYPLNGVKVGTSVHFNECLRQTHGTDPVHFELGRDSFIMQVGSLRGKVFCLPF